MATLIVLSSGEWLSCAVCSVSDICVRLYSLYQASGGPRKLNPISVFIQPVSLDVYTALRFAPSVSLCAWVACQMQPAVLKRAQLHYCTWCVCLLVCVCVCVCSYVAGTHATGSLDPTCVARVAHPFGAPVAGCRGSWSLQQSHVRFMPPPDVSWFYKRREKGIQMAGLREKEDGGVGRGVEWVIEDRTKNERE